MKESEILKAITNYLQLKENLGELYFTRVGSGGIKTEAGGYFKSGKAGAPDIVMCYQGEFYALEVKNEKGRQTESQKDAEKKIKKAKGKYFIIRNIDDLVDNVF